MISRLKHYKDAINVPFIEFKVYSLVVHKDKRGTRKYLTYRML